MIDRTVEVRPLFVGTDGYRSTGWWALLGLIATEGALFGYLLFSYYYVSVQPHAAWPPSGKPPFLYSVPETVVMLLGCASMWLADRSARRGAMGSVLAGLAVSLVLSAIFIGLEFAEWYSQPFSLSTDVYSSLYFANEGAHLAHVAFGFLMLIALIVWTAMGYFGRERHVYITIGAYYWYFMAAVWIAIFFTFYITPYLT